MALYREAQQYPGKERQVFEFYQKTPEAMANLRAPIFEDKVVDFIIDLAKVTERGLTAEQLRKEMEAEAEAAEGAEPKKKPAKKKAAKKKAAKKKAAKSDESDDEAEPKNDPAEKSS